MAQARPARHFRAAGPFRGGGAGTRLLRGSSGTGRLWDPGDPVRAGCGTREVRYGRAGGCGARELRYGWAVGFGSSGTGGPRGSGPGLRGRAVPGSLARGWVLLYPGERGPWERSRAAEEGEVGAGH